MLNFTARGKISQQLLDPILLALLDLANDQAATLDKVFDGYFDWLAQLFKRSDEAAELLRMIHISYELFINHKNKHHIAERAEQFFNFQQINHFQIHSWWIHQPVRFDYLAFVAKFVAFKWSGLRPRKYVLACRAILARRFIDQVTWQLDWNIFRRRGKL